MTENEHKALKTVRKYMWWSMGAGLIPFCYVDLVAVSGVQLKMLSEIAKRYGVLFRTNQGKELVGALVGTLAPGAVGYGIGCTIVKSVPVVGFIVGGAAQAVLSGATTWALGKVFIQHFESGGTFLDLNPDDVRGYFKAQFEEGKTMAAAMASDKKA